MTKIEEAKKKVVVFRGRKYYYESRFTETVFGKKCAKEYSKKLAKDTKSWTLVRRVPDVGYCIYVSKTMKRGGKI